MAASAGAAEEGGGAQDPRFKRRQVTYSYTDLDNAPRLALPNQEVQLHLYGVVTMCTEPKSTNGRGAPPAPPSRPAS